MKGLRIRTTLKGIEKQKKSAGKGFVVYHEKSSKNEITTEIIFSDGHKANPFCQRVSENEKKKAPRNNTKKKRGNKQKGKKT